ncbi:SNF1-related protein kinase regulatory subunit gamma-1-like [Hibiscus syriacus]|uniref:SNF1-related protein kinase regulatory subunit gamma-1-like n=1 Tax=Hibiscus syriacus TaxID=106335 RepID=A0A6A3AP74_HIBSY|nr:SNF1-related protein kinase regulatory subunit gamma-1-like [Hibiscus syriacus]
MISLDDGEGPTQEEITNRWFGQDIFVEAVEQGDLGKYDSDDEMETDKRWERAAIPERSKVKKKQDEKLNIPNKDEEKKANNAAGPESTKLQASKADDDFEIVLAPATDSSDDSYSDDLEDDDVETKAEVLACAKKMLRKMQRDQILDDAYGKYMFHDDGLPKWFLDEEKRHCQPIKPVTKEEIAAMRAQFKEINARLYKKVAEEKARKKRIAMKKLDKKATPKKPQKEYVVARKGVQVMAGMGKVLVDRRMKKDARARGTGKPGKGGSKKGKNRRARKADSWSMHSPEVSDTKSSVRGSSMALMVPPICSLLNVAMTNFSMDVSLTVSDVSSDGCWDWDLLNTLLDLIAIHHMRNIIAPSFAVAENETLLHILCASPLGAFGRDSSKLILFPLSLISIMKLGSWKISVLLSVVPRPMALGAFFSPHWSDSFGRLKIFSFFKMPLLVRKLYFKSAYPGANFTMTVRPFGVHTDCKPLHMFNGAPRIF